jgi:hypothetical protein
MTLRGVIALAALGVAAAAASVGGLLTASIGLVTASLAAPATAAVGIFPSDRLTVRDPAQLTGKRVRLSRPDCVARPSDCAEIASLNRLDGFDVQPRFEVRFERPIRLAAVSRDTLSIRPVQGGTPLGLDRLVWHRPSRTLYGTPEEQLDEATTYRISIARALGGRAASTTFTTMSTTAPTIALAARVRRMRPRLRVDGAVPAGTPLVRLVDRGGAAPVEEVVPDLSAAGAARYVFGALAAPSWLARDRTIALMPTRRVPRRTGTARTPFALIVPAGTPPAGGWPVAIFGHGFLRSHYDVFLAARANAARGVATIAIDAVGHGGGRRGAVLAGAAEIAAPGRGTDVDRDGSISDVEGLRTAPQPARDASVALRDTLRQTALDTVALAAALRRGVPGVPELSRRHITYYGQSLGAIYGTLVAALEPRLARSVLNVGGGPVIDVVRLSPGFRPLLLADLAARRPPVLAQSATLDEQLPPRLDPPVTAPSPTALAVQEVLTRIAWLTRAGSPEAYAPLLRPEATLVQAAFGDQTVPNPTTDALVRAGGLETRTWLFRNDRTATAAANPHGFLLDPVSPGSLLGQAQALAFLRAGRLDDPDGAAGVFEPLRGDVLARLNF